jgi:hypothetical protein
MAFDTSLLGLVQYACTIALFIAFQRAFEHYKFEATRPTLRSVLCCGGGEPSIG